MIQEWMAFSRSLYCKALHLRFMRGSWLRFINYFFFVKKAHNYCICEIGFLVFPQVMTQKVFYYKVNFALLMENENRQKCQKLWKQYEYTYGWSKWLVNLSSKLNNELSLRNLRGLENYSGLSLSRTRKGPTNLSEIEKITKNKNFY